MSRPCSNTHLLFAAVGLGLLIAQVAAAAPNTIDEAIELSQKTGRPILAFAGQET